jgi:hypothetical protein
MDENQSPMEPAEIPLARILPDYPSPVRYDDRPGRLMYGAMICGAIPLLLACGIFVAWLFTRDLGLAFVGFLNIGLGLCFFLVGSAMLAAHLFSFRERRLGRFLATSWVAIILLLINFPACWGIIRAVNYVETTYPIAANAMD